MMIIYTQIESVDETLDTTWIVFFKLGLYDSVMSAAASNRNLCVFFTTYTISILLLLNFRESVPENFIGMISPSVLLTLPLSVGDLNCTVSFLLESDNTEASHVVNIFLLV